MVVKERPEYPAIFVSDGTTLITLWQVQDVDNAKEFDREIHIGLHHLALKVDSPELLNKLYAKILMHNAVVEFAPEAIGEGPAQHYVFYEPGGIRIELYAVIT